MQQDVLETLRGATDISGISAHLVSVLSKENGFTLLYVVPTVTDGKWTAAFVLLIFMCFLDTCIKENVTFVSMDDLMDYPEQLEEFERYDV